MKHSIANTLISTVKCEGIAYNLSSASIDRDRLSPIQFPAEVSTSTEMTQQPSLSSVANYPSTDTDKIDSPGPVHDLFQSHDHGHGEKKLHKCSLCGRFFSTSFSFKIHTTRWCTNKRVVKQKIQKQRIRSRQICTGNQSNPANITENDGVIIKKTENSPRLRKSNKTKPDVESPSATRRRSSRTPKARFHPETLSDNYQHQDQLDEYNNGPENDNVENKVQTSQPQQRMDTTVTATKTNQTFFESQQLPLHNSSILSPFACRFCTQCFASGENRSIHENERHMPAVNPYKCKSCERRFIFAADCCFHEALHSESWSKLQLAEPDSKKFKKGGQINTLSSTASSSNQSGSADSSSSSGELACKFCSTRTCFKTKQGLRIHIGRRHHHDFQNQRVVNNAAETGTNPAIATATGGNSTPVPQPSLTSIPIAIQRIMEVKTNTNTKRVNLTKPFVCSTCNKGFSTSGSRNIHNKIHIGDFPYVCKFCGRKYVCVGKLNYHLKVSACAPKNRMLVSGNTYEAEAEADAETTGKNNLQIKRKQLKGRSKKFPCNVCGKRLKSRITLIQHALVHSKPFTCQYCPKLTSRKDLWLRHEKIHTGASQTKYFFCHVCNLPCRPLKQLQIHLKEVHSQ